MVFALDPCDADLVAGSAAHPRLRRQSLPQALYTREEELWRCTWRSRYSLARTRTQRARTPNRRPSGTHPPPSLGLDSIGKARGPGCLRRAVDKLEEDATATAAELQSARAAKVVWAEAGERWWWRGLNPSEVRGRRLHPLDPNLMGRPLARHRQITRRDPQLPLTASTFATPLASLHVPSPEQVAGASAHPADPRQPRVISGAGHHRGGPLALLPQHVSRVPASGPAQSQAVAREHIVRLQGAQLRCRRLRTRFHARYACHCGGAVLAAAGRRPEEAGSG